MSIERAWYQGSAWLHLLRPLAALFTWLSGRVKKRDQTLARPGNLPVVVVGNITVGGTGKTPLLVSLVKQLQQQGYKPGVISRGYGSRSKTFPLSIAPDTSAKLAGDEPLLIAQACACPLVIAPERIQALAMLQQQFDCDIVLSDDGLQHYRLYRQLEIAVVDGQRGLGNGFCLPAGPLREVPERLQQVDWVLINQASAAIDTEIRQLCRHHSPVSSMAMQFSQWRSLYDGRCVDVVGLPEAAAGKTVYAMAAIGNPQRFFDTLAEQGISAVNKPFPDHHAYSDKDLEFGHGQIVLMTAKDAVKCSQYQAKKQAQHWWILDVEARLEPEFVQDFSQRIKDLVKSEPAA